MRKLNIGKIKAILLLMFFLPVAFTMKGEGKEDTKEKIMEIKLNDEYIFGEGVSDDKEIAYGVAMEDLLAFANELKTRNSQEKFSMSDLITNVETIVYEDGSRFEVIVYIPFKIVIDKAPKQSPAKTGVVLTRPGILDDDDSDDIEIEEEMAIAPANPPVNETPLATAPVAKTPVKETPVVEATVAETPVVETQVVETPVAESTVVETPVAEETVEELIAIEEPVAAPAHEPAPQIISENPNKKTSGSATVYDGEIEGFLLTQDNFSEIKSFLSDMKAAGKIVETGATDSASNLPKDASLILMDEMGGILAILSPVNAQGRMNYRTHNTDSENNYNSKFILWYRK